MVPRTNRPSPATVLASIALLVSLSGTAIAAVPVAKKALFAKNAGKLQGKTARQVAAIPGPATTLNGLTAQSILSVAANATTLNGKTLDEVAAIPGPATDLNGKTADEIATLPGPANTARQLVEITSASFSLAAGAEGDQHVSCPGSDYVISGGWTTTDSVLAADTRPTGPTSWAVYLINASNTDPASGLVYAICIK